MKVYMVQNNDNIVMAICLTKRKAKSIAVTIGQHRWHENWSVTPVTLDEVDPGMLCGSESYRRMTRKMNEQQTPKTSLSEGC